MDNQVDYGKLSEKLPKKINYSLEKGKEMNKDWKDNELSLLINNCINIEKNLSDINEIKWEIEKSNLNMETKILFKPEQEGINDIINTIKNFGEIYLDNYKQFPFKNCPINSKDEMNINFINTNNSNNSPFNMPTNNQIINTNMNVFNNFNNINNENKNINEFFNNNNNISFQSNSNFINFQKINNN